MQKKQSSSNSSNSKKNDDRSSSTDSKNNSKSNPGSSKDSKQGTTQQSAGSSKGSSNDKKNQNNKQAEEIPEKKKKNNDMWAEEPPQPEKPSKPRWTGKSALTQWNEYCQREKIRFSMHPWKSKEGEFQLKTVIHKKSGDEVVFPLGPTLPTLQDARHAAAVCCLASECGNLSLEHVLPPEWRDLWKQCKQRNSEEKAREEKQELNKQKQKEREQREEKHLDELPQMIMNEKARNLAQQLVMKTKQESNANNDHDENENNNQNQTQHQNKSNNNHNNRTSSGSFRRARDDPNFQLKRKLNRMGFQNQQIENAFSAVSKSTPNAPPTLDSIMDWLLLNLKDQDLPKDFNPAYSSLEIVKLLPLQLQWIVNAGFPSKLTEDVFENHSAKDPLRTLSELYHRLVFLDKRLSPYLSNAHSFAKFSANNNGTPSSESLTIIQGEFETLKTVFEDQITSISQFPFETQQSSSSIIKGITLKVKKDLSINFYFTEQYPIKSIPITMIFQNKLSQQKKLRLMRELSFESVKLISSGSSIDGMLFALKSWLDDNLDLILNEKESVVVDVQEEDDENEDELENETQQTTTTTSSSNTNPTTNPKPTPQQQSEKNEEVKPQQHKKQHNNNNNRNNNHQNNNRRRISLPTQKQIPSLIKEQRERLPITSYKKQILEKINQNDVLVISGETGSGKSTQLPQYILEQAQNSEEDWNKCNVVVTQPRRISAIGLANRVSQERGETVGESVGFQIRLQSTQTESTRLLFCTTGVVLRKLLDPSALSSISHIIVDECHERNLETDFLLIILKRIWHQQQRLKQQGKLKTSPLKIILMSATMNFETFANYFANAPILAIPGFTFPVESIFSDQAIPMLRKWNPDLVNSILKKTKEEQEDEDTESETPKEERKKGGGDRDDSDATFGLIELLVRWIFETNFKSMKADKDKSESILIFVSGIAQISYLVDSLSSISKQLLVLPLHSSLPMEQQQAVFKRPPPGQMKVIISTNIAETSVTIDDVRYVIDTGKANSNVYDPLTKISSLKETWVSKASCRQRKGRAGRVKAGFCYFAFSSKHFEQLREYETPEILRTPLHHLCLQALAFISGEHNKQAHDNTILKFLLEAIDPPSPKAVESAVSFLTDLGAIDIKPDGSQHLTPLGQHLVNLPTDVQIGKSLLFGAILRCLDPVLTICAFLSYKTPFVSPLDKRDEANVAKNNFAVAKSDHLTVVQAYNKWQEVKKNGKKASRQWCFDNFLSEASLEMISDLRKQYAELLSTIGFLNTNVDLEQIETSAEKSKTDGLKELTYSLNYGMVKAALTAGLYPNIIKVDFPEKSYTETLQGNIQNDYEARAIRFTVRSEDDPKKQDRVFLHPSSVVFTVNSFESPFLVYFQKVQTSKLYVRDCSMIYPWPLFIFGSKEIVVNHEKQTLKMNGYIEVKANAKVAVLIKELQQKFSSLMKQKIVNPNEDISQSPFVDVVSQLIISNGQL